jgi:hypothetical protein
VLKSLNYLPLAIAGNMAMAMKELHTAAKHFTGRTTCPPDCEPNQGMLT